MNFLLKKSLFTLIDLSFCKFYQPLTFLKYALNLIKFKTKFVRSQLNFWNSKFIKFSGHSFSNKCQRSVTSYIIPSNLETLKISNINSRLQYYSFLSDLSLLLSLPHSLSLKIKKMCKSNKTIYSIYVNSTSVLRLNTDTIISLL